MLDSFLSPSWLHTALLLVMITMILTGRRSGARDQRIRLAVEQAGLRAGLIAEIAALRAVYRLNLDLIAAGAPQLVSGRPYFSIYRGNMGRLVGLSPAEVEAVVAAHAACDTLDSAVQIGMRMRARKADSALWEAKGLDLWRLQRAARLTAEDAQAVLAAAADAAAQARRRTWHYRFLAWRQGGATAAQAG